MSTEELDPRVASEHYFTASSGLVGEAYQMYGGGRAALIAAESVKDIVGGITICVLALRGGGAVVGHVIEPNGFEYCWTSECKKARAMALAQLPPTE